MQNFDEKSYNHNERLAIFISLLLCLVLSSAIFVPLFLTLHSNRDNECSEKKSNTQSVLLADNVTSSTFTTNTFVVPIYFQTSAPSSNSFSLPTLSQGYTSMLFSSSFSSSTQVLSFPSLYSTVMSSLPVTGSVNRVYSETSGGLTPLSPLSTQFTYCYWVSFFGSYYTPIYAMGYINPDKVVSFSIQSLYDNSYYVGPIETMPVANYTQIKIHDSLGLSLTLNFIGGYFNAPNTPLMPYREYFYSQLSDSESYDQGYNSGYQIGNQEGQQQGYNDGFSTGKLEGIGEGFNQGYNEGIRDSNKYSFLGLIGAVFDAPIQAFNGLFDFELLGVNMRSFMLALLTLCAVVTVLRIVRG